MELRPLVNSCVDEILEELKPLYEELSDNNLNQYSDVVMSVMTNLKILKETIHNANLSDRINRI